MFDGLYIPPKPAIIRERPKEIVHLGLGTLMLNPLVGFGPRQPISASFGNNLISQSGGTAIGDLTSFGGLAAAFDGTTSQVHTACAAGSSQAWIGRTLAASSLISKIELWGSSNAGLSADPQTYTIKLWGKSGSFVDESTGTVLATTSGVAPGTTTMITLTNPSDFTMFDHWWGTFETSSAGQNTFIAEIRAYD